MKPKSKSKQKRRSPCPYCGEKLSARTLYNHKRYRTCTRKAKDNTKQRLSSAHSKCRQPLNVELDHSLISSSEEEDNHSFEYRECNGKFLTIRIDIILLVSIVRNCVQPFVKARCLPRDCIFSSMSCSKVARNISTTS